MKSSSPPVPSLTSSCATRPSIIYAGTKRCVYYICPSIIYADTKRCAAKDVFHEVLLAPRPVAHVELSLQSVLTISHVPGEGGARLRKGGPMSYEARPL